MPKSFIPGVFFAGILLITTLPLFAVEHEVHEQHAAHVHGQAELLVAIDSRLMQIEFHSPAFNLLGFEHPPRNLQETEQLANAAQLLEQGDVLFSLPHQAGCKLQKVDTQIPFGQASAKDHEAHTAEAHADFSGHYLFDCQTPKELRQFKVKLFDLFPLIGEIQGQVISTNVQRSLNLYPGEDIVDL